MTLVLSCLTQDYAIQVSDRRITRLGSGEVVEDTRNKGTVYCNQFALAYSGLAEIDGQPTDEWLAETLGAVTNFNEGSDAIVRRATESFARLKWPAETKKHAFVGVGWVQTEWSGGETVPGVCVFSNALDSAWAWKPRAEQAFTKDGLGVAGSKPYLLCPPIGANVRSDELTRLDRDISACVRHEVHPLEIIRLLGTAIRKVAAYTPTVGQSLLATVLPKSAATNPRAMLLMALTPLAARKIDTPMFYHLPKGSDDLSVHTPNFVCNGFVSIQGSFTPGWGGPR